MKKLFVPLLLYCAVVAVVFGKALLPPDGQLIYGDDIHHQYYYYRQFFNDFFKQGIFPWWNPYNFSGAPFIANPVVNIWYLPTWLFVFLPLNVAYSWHLALHILWAMIGMFTLLRRVMSKLPAWVGGLVFGLSGFFAARVWAGHVDVIAAASWMPWVFGAFWQLLHDQRTNFRHGWNLCASANRAILVAVVVFSLQLLAGYQTMAFMTAIAVGIVSLLHCLPRYTALRAVIEQIPKARSKVLWGFIVRSLKPVIRVLLAVLIGLGLAGIQIIPVQEFVRHSIRTFSFPYSWHSYGSLTVESLKQFLNPFAFGDQLTYHGPAPNFAEHAFFVGRLGILLLPLAFFAGIRVWLPFALIALFGLWVSLGPNAPLDLQYILWKILPMYHYLRIPPRHLILMVFGLSALAGRGLSLARPPLARLGIATVIVVEMIFYARHFITLKPIPETRHDEELVKIFAQDKEPYRVLTNFGAWISPRDSFDFDAAMSYRVFNATGYDPSILRSYYEYIDIANGNPPGSSILDHDVQVPYLNVFSSTTDFLNIKYLLVPRAYDPLYGVASDRFVLLREDVGRDYRLYENNAVKPRFFMEKGTVTIEKYTPNEIVVSTQSPVGETLVSSEVYYPGWEGFVDGQRVDVTKANHAFRALFVPAGRHQIIYRYTPRIFWIGSAISVVSLGVCFLLWKKSAAQ